MLHDLAPLFCSSCPRIHKFSVGAEMFFAKFRILPIRMFSQEAGKENSLKIGISEWLVMSYAISHSKLLVEYSVKAFQHS